MSLFGQSILGSASRASMKSFQSQVMSSQMSGMSVASDMSDKRSNTSVNQPEAQKSTKAKKNVEELTPQDLEKNITIILDETETHTSFKLFGDLAQEGRFLSRPQPNLTPSSPQSLPCLTLIQSNIIFF